MFVDISESAHENLKENDLFFCEGRQLQYRVFVIVLRHLVVCQISLLLAIVMEDRASQGIEDSDLKAVRLYLGKQLKVLAHDIRGFTWQPDHVESMSVQTIFFASRNASMTLPCVVLRSKVSFLNSSSPLSTPIATAAAPASLISFIFSSVMSSGRSMNVKGMLT